MNVHSFTDLIYPDCHLCRTLRISMCAATLIVVTTYMGQLIQIGVELRREGRR